MRLETFRGRDVSSVHSIARRELGEDALILETKDGSVGGRTGIEVLATRAADLAHLVNLVIPRRTEIRHRKRQRVVAVVGPTGAGKTTTIAKLATHPRAFGTQRVGLLTLDTHRAAGFEQLNAYADAAELPCYIAYDAAEATKAMRRLESCDVVLIDNAGRGPKAHEQTRRAQKLLTQLRPDEVHLVVPASVRLDLASRILADHAYIQLTHAILTKLDEVPADRSLAFITAALGLPMRWVADGQEVPSNLRPAAASILRPLGITHLTKSAA